MLLRTKLTLSFAALLILAMGANWFAVANRTRAAVRDNSIQRATAIAEMLDAGSLYARWLPRRAEELVGSQMLVQAALAAHFVDVAENRASMGPEEIRARLKDVAQRTAVDEFWITDEAGAAYLRNRVDIDFTFPDAPTARDQGHVFRRLLESRDGQLVQDAMPRELDGEVFKYAGVSGLDRPRIVQVGYKADSLAELTAGMHPGDLLQSVVGHAGILRVLVARADGALELDATPEALRLSGAADAPVVDLVQKALDDRVPAWRLDGDVLTVAYPRPDAETALVGYFDAGSIRAHTIHAMAIMSLASAGILLLGAVLASRISRKIAAPVQQLAEEASRIGRGDLDRRVEVQAGGEVGVLANALNDMVASLNVHVQRLREATAFREHLETEMKIAAQVQAAMLPKQLPRRRDVEMAVLTQPARVVGGDFFDVAELPDGRVAIVLGDASGKGLPAALFATQCLSMLRAQVLGAGMTRPVEVLNRANRLLLSTCRTEDLFATLFFGIYDPAERALTFGSAGHLPHLTAKPGAAAPETRAGALPLGILEEFDAEEITVTLSPGETLLLYTDGVTDAANGQGEMFGIERVLACLSEEGALAPEDLVACLKRRVDEFIGQGEAADDMTLLALRLA